MGCVTCVWGGVGSEWLVVRWSGVMWGGSLVVRWGGVGGE